MNWKTARTREMLSGRHPQAESRTLKEIFYEAGRINGLSQSTIYRYWRWVRRFILLRRPPIHPAHLTDVAVIEFIKSLPAKSLGSISIAQAIDALRFTYRHVLPKRPLLLAELSKLRKMRADPRGVVSSKNRSGLKMLIQFFKRVVNNLKTGKNIRRKPI